MAQKTLVLDASVVVKWYFEELGSDYAQEIYTAFKNRDLELAAPSLFYYEVANAVRYTKLSDKEKGGIIKSLFALKLKTFEASEGVFMLALKLARVYDATIYDSTYLALAKKLGCKYVTADMEFCKKVKKDAVALERWREAV